MRSFLRHSCLVLVFAATALPCALAQPDPRFARRDDWNRPDRIIADLNLKPGMAVADIGAGGGYFTPRLSEAVGAQGTVFATEINDKQLAGLKRKMGAQRTNIEYVLSEPTDTKLAPNSLDAVLMCLVIHEVSHEQRPALVKDIAESLKPGAVLAIVDWRKMEGTPGHDTMEEKLTPEEMLALGRQAGLALDAEFHYLAYQQFVRFRKPDPAEPKPATGAPAK